MNRERSRLVEGDHDGGGGAHSIAWCNTRQSGGANVLGRSVLLQLWLDDGQMSRSRQDLELARVSLALSRRTGKRKGISSRWQKTKTAFRDE